MNRPVLWAALSFAGGIAAVDLSPWPIFLTAMGAITLLVLFVVPHPLPYRDGFLIALIFFVAGATWTAIRAPERHTDDLARHNRDHPNALYTLEGTVESAPIYSPGMDYMSVQLRVEATTSEKDRPPIAGKVLLRWTKPSRALHPGERVQLRGTLSPQLGQVNLGMGGVEDYYRLRGIHSVIRAKGDQVHYVAAPRLHIGYWASRLRAWEAGVFAQTVPESARGLIQAVWLGDRSDLDPATKDPFLQTGTAHILAVSGVHIGILYLTLQLVLRTLIRNRKGRLALILGVILLFALVTGARTPILRATLMLTIYVWAEFLNREPDGPTALSLAALLFLGYNPALLLDGGFALSFTSLGSLLLFSGPLSERMAALPLSLRQNLSATLAVSLLPLPLIGHTFHVLSLVGPLCNLVVIPLLSLLLWLALLTVVFAPLSIAVASLFGHATVPIAGLIMVIADWGAAVPGGHYTVTSPTGWASIAYGGLALCIYRWIVEDANARRWGYRALCAGLCTVLLWQPFAGPATLDVLDVGHGDTIFLRTPGGTTLLVDSGDHSEYVDQGGRTVVPWLLNQGIKHLDYLVVTHPDKDHIGGTAAVLDGIAVGTVVLWPMPSENELAQRLVQQCETLNVPIHRVGVGDTLPADGGTIRVLHPDPEHHFGNINDESIVLHVQWPGMSALLTGDIEAPAEAYLAAHLPQVDILKVPHHGSNTSSTEALLQATNPQLALVSTGRKGTREALAAPVAQRYAEHDIPIYRTDQMGGIQIREVGGKLQVRTARGEQGYSLAPRER